MRTIVYSTLDKKILDEWQELWDKSPLATYVNGRQWFVSVIECFQYKDYKIIAVYSENCLMAVAGLIKEKRYGVEVYTVPPGDFVCGDPFLLDYQSEKVNSALFNAINDLGNIILDNVSEEFVTNIKKCTMKFSAAQYGVNYIMDIHESEDGLVYIPDRRKMLRGIKKNNIKFSYKYCDGNKTSLKDVFLIDSQSRKQSRGYSTFSQQKIREFYTILSKYFEKEFKVNILYSGKDPVVYELGFLIKNKYYSNQVAFAEQYAQFGPGKVLDVRIIENLAAQGIKYLDLGSGESYIKKSLASDCRQLYKVIISKRYAVRMYLKKTYEMKGYVFEMIKKNRSLYTMYRSIRKSFE